MTAHGVVSSPSRNAAATPVSGHRISTRKVLLACGIAAPLLYVAMLIFVPLGWPGYSSAAQTVSELSAIGAPTRLLWMALGALYTMLLAAFGWGILLSARGSRALRVVGGLMVACGVLGLFWPPMHLRGTEFTLTDTLHIVWMAVSGLLTLVAMGIAAAAFGRRFRAYSVATMVILLATGAMTGAAAPNVAADLPTPWIGVWERVSAVVWMLWLGVLAVAMLRRTGGVGLHRARSVSGGGTQSSSQTASEQWSPAAESHVGSAAGRNGDGG